MSKACKHILIVDDAATVRMYHRSILEEAGYTVAEAVNGLEALEKTASAPYDPPFDLFLVDVNMPQMDGYGFLRALRAGDGVQAPAIMISTEAEDGARRLAFQAGANHYLAKPIRPQQLLRVVKLLLGETT